MQREFVLKIVLCVRAWRVVVRLKSSKYFSEVLNSYANSYNSSQSFSYDSNTRPTSTYTHSLFLNGLVFVWEHTKHSLNAICIVYLCVSEFILYSVVYIKQFYASTQLFSMVRYFEALALELGVSIIIWPYIIFYPVSYTFLHFLCIFHVRLVYIL